MPNIKLDDVTMIYPFISTTGLFNRKEKEKILQKQKEMPYTSNEGVVALQHFSTQIPDGRFVVVVGPSGSGKSTLLRLIAGLEKPSLGKVYFDDEVMNYIKPEQRDIAMVFQNYSLYPNQSVYDNIAFPLRNQHLPRVEIDKKVNEMLTLLHLNGKEERLPDELSGGEKQRVAIARALIRKPKLFLLDEPFSNLDEMMKNTLRVELKRIQKELGITFIYVTHDQKDALILADRLIVLKDGIVQQDDSINKVYNYPSNIFAGQFVGFPTMNIFENIEVKNNEFIFFNKKYKLNTKQTKELKGQNLTIGIRPFNIHIAGTGVEATVNNCEIDGNDLIICSKIDKLSITIVERNLNQYGYKYYPGQTIKLQFDEDYFYYFTCQGKGIN